MRTWILNTVLALAFLITANTNLQAQFDFEFCGSTFKVNCDGTVNVDLAENVFIYKVWDGPNLIAEWNNFTPAPNVIYTPFVGGQPPFGNPVQPGQNVYLDVQTEDCGQFILNISQVLSENCAGFLIGDFDDSEFSTAPSNASVDELNAYPNPAIDQVTISLPIIDENYNLQLLDLNGSVLRQQSISGGNQQFDLQGLPSGTYLLSAQSGDKVYTKRILKN
mgnify:CR=1 FL=1